MIFNGRLNLAEEGGTSTFLQDKIPVDSQTNHDNIMGVEDWEKTTLSCTYFSKENIKIIQNGIRAGVYEMSKQQYIIDNQDVEILNTIMRSIFLQYSSNLEKNIAEQIAALNKLVIDYCVPKLYVEARSYLIYKKDVSTLVIPMSNPTYANHNDKTLHLKHFF